jgi:hypothetical protein
LTPIDPSIYKALLDQVNDGVYIWTPTGALFTGTKGRHAKRAIDQKKWWDDAVPKMGSAISM